MAHQTFGRYEIKEELGRGGMATVYRAYDPNFGREVALKVLPHEFLHDTTFRARFEREAHTIAALEHQAIVPVYDFGEQGGQPFLVMRYMPGGSLAERIAQGPIPLTETVRLIGQLAPALDTAHGHGVIHRDLKPSNILFDREGNVYLSDFGIAKVAQETTALTGGGGIIGTPAYMSPEQGRGQAVDWRSDLYSLGVIVFQMLSGQLPYWADTPIGMIHAHVYDPIPDVLEANPALPATCAVLVVRAMAKDPAERYQTAREMANDLSVALSAPAGAPGLAPLPTKPLPPAPSYAPTVDVVEPAAMPRTEKIPTTPVQKPARGGMSVWAWIGGTVVMIGVFVGGLALSGVLGGGAEKTPQPTHQAAGSAPATPTTPSSAIPTSEPTNVPTATPTLTAGEQARALAEAGVTRNADWTPYTEEINGVLMALVPVGCFMMGSEDDYSGGWPVHEVCFEQPFRIDVYEVTNSQFAAFGGQAGRPSYWTNAYRPRESILWDEAKSFCGEKRGARLPTEAEWEYAARGPDGLVYPWGNQLVADNVVYGENSGGHTWDVGSRPDGMSWVGAFDLSGNVSEWVNDWYGDYPSGQQVNPTGPESGNWHMWRGGTWGGYYEYLRAGYRDAGYVDIRSFATYGFRCALSYQP